METFERKGYDLDMLEKRGFTYNPFVNDIDGGLIYQKTLYQEGGKTKHSMSFLEAKRCAEKSFKELLKEPRLMTAKEFTMAFITDSELEEDVENRLREDVKRCEHSVPEEWVDGTFKHEIEISPTNPFIKYFYFPKERGSEEIKWETGAIAGALRINMPLASSTAYPSVGFRVCSSL